MRDWGDLGAKMVSRDTKGREGKEVTGRDRKGMGKGVRWDGMGWDGREGGREGGRAAVRLLFVGLRPFNEY